jgi:hypothetical protein
MTRGFIAVNLALRALLAVALAGAPAGAAG